VQFLINAVNIIISCNSIRKFKK